MKPVKGRFAVPAPGVGMGYRSRHALALEVNCTGSPSRGQVIFVYTKLDRGNELDVLAYVNNITEKSTAVM